MMAILMLAVLSGMIKQTSDNGVVSYSGGSGERTIVLVHGVNEQSATWAAVAPQLMRDFRVIAIDLPGHGESAPKTGPLPMRAMIDALSAVIGDRQVILVGNSMGGWVSMLYAAEHPDRVSQLILEDASGMAWDLRNVPLFPQDREQAIKLLRMVAGPDAPIADETIEFVLHAKDLPQKRVIDAGILDWIVDARLPKLTMPVTLIWGKNDGLLPLAYANTLQSRIAGSKLHVIDHAAHIPHRQAPDEFLRLLREAVR
ncbi:MAG TPA: alpha/beta hydrolase [Thermoanaerobaculia bacterium]|nr:alpha/beta hydrolase [Thermoanaerobaculia bacterium]